MVRFWTPYIDIPYPSLLEKGAKAEYDVRTSIKQIGFSDQQQFLWEISMPGKEI